MNAADTTNDCSVATDQIMNTVLAKVNMASVNILDISWMADLSLLAWKHKIASPTTMADECKAKIIRQHCK